MIQFLKRLLPREPLPPNVHLHRDGDGNRVPCDGAGCQPVSRRDLRFIAPLR